WRRLTRSARAFLDGNYGMAKQYHPTLPDSACSIAQSYCRGLHLHARRTTIRRPQALAQKAHTPMSRQQEMATLIKRLAPQEGYTRSLLGNVWLMRSNRPLGRTPVLYEPCIVIRSQERRVRKRCYTRW